MTKAKCKVEWRRWRNGEYDALLWSNKKTKAASSWKVINAINGFKTMPRGAKKLAVEKKLLNGCAELSKARR